MFSVSPAEILTIAVVALLVFGPKRLPEIAKKAGKVVGDLKRAAEGLRAEFEAELEEPPLDEARRRMRSTPGATEPESSPE